MESSTKRKCDPKVLVSIKRHKKLVAEAKKLKVSIKELLEEKLKGYDEFFKAAK